jgi:hypothetical protein
MRMNMSRTPRPWEWRGNRLTSETGQTVCILPDYDAGDGPHDKLEQEATQRLLHSAPDLLAALVALLDDNPYTSSDIKCECGRFDERGTCCHVAARAAIDKAEGV